ncbi:MAG TPA: RNA polymerase subunit sigma, partial [Firmicutes bacterium]|nr:RNA polymerase subunit sigma [Bacillota bacterium]
IENLSKNQQEVMLLRVSVDLSFREIGELLGQTENWARVTFYRAKTKLREGDDGA